MSSQRANAAALSHEHVLFLAHGKRSNCARGVQLPRRVIEHHLALLKHPPLSIAVLVLRRERVSACCESLLRDSAGEVA